MMGPDTRSALKKLWGRVKEQRFTALVLLLGLVLLLLPAGGGGESEPESAPPETASAADGGADLERRLEEILSLVEGAGQVRVLLTFETTGRTVYATDTRESRTSRDGESGVDTETTHVTVPEGSGVSAPVETERLGPKYRGAVVLAQGADSAQVRLALTEAVSAATGLSSESVRIIRMK